MGNVCLIRTFQVSLHTCLTVGTEILEMGQVRPLHARVLSGEADTQIQLCRRKSFGGTYGRRDMRKKGHNLAVGWDGFIEEESLSRKSKNEMIIPDQIPETKRSACKTQGSLRAKQDLQAEPPVERAYGNLSTPKSTLRGESCAAPQSKDMSVLLL